MHKKFFLALSLLACMGVTACNNGGGDGGGEEEPPAPDLTAELQYSDTKVVDNALLEANAEIGVDPYVDERSHAEVVASPEDELDVIDTRFENSGLQVVRGENGYIGFYSLLQNDWLLAPQFVPEDPHFQYTVNTNGLNGVGFILNVVYGDDNNANEYDMVTVDGFGNEINVPSNYTRWPDYYEHETVDDKYYLAGRYYDHSDDHFDLFYEYSSNGSCRQVEEIPEPSGGGSGGGEEYEFYEGPFYDQLYKEGWLDLTPIGMTGKSIAYKNGYYTVFEDETAVSNFYVDSSNELIGTINGAMYFQKAVELPESTLIYSYSVGLKKYALNQFMYSLSTGERTELHFPVKFEQFEVLNPTLTGSYYQVVSYQPITEKLVLGDKVSYVADKDFVLHDNVSGVHVSNFVRYAVDPSSSTSKARYFNTTTNVLYDENFKVITYLGEMKPTYKNCFNMFEGTKNGKKGLVDLNGKVRLEFKYDSIEYDSFLGNAGLAIKNSNEVWKVNLVNGNEERLGYNLMSQYSDLDHSALYSYNEYDSSNAPRILYSVRHGELFTVNEQLGSKTYLDKYHVVFAKDYEGAVRVVKYQDFVPQAIPADTKGEAVEPAIVDGSTAEKAIALTNDISNSINLRALEEVYVKFEVESESAEGFYYFHYNSTKLSFREATVDGEYYSVTDYSYAYPTNFPVVGAYVEYGKTVILEFECSYNSARYAHLKDVTAIHVEKTQGVELNYPVEIKALNTVYSAQIPYHYVQKSVATSNFYATFTAAEAGMYRYKTDTNKPSSIYIISDEGEETQLADVDMPIRLAASETIKLRIHFETPVSSASFHIAKEAYQVATYDAQGENYLAVPAETAACDTFYVTFAAPSDHYYRVSVASPSVLSRVYADGNVSTNGIFYATEGETVTLIVVVNDQIQAGNQVAYTIDEYVDPMLYVSISLDADGATSYAWTEEYGVYSSSNYHVSNSTSSMTITFSHAGTFSFEYMNYGESGCDYLYVNKNSGQLINCSNSHSTTFYNYEVEVEDGDVLTFVYRKDGSVDHDPDCARIKNINFVLA